MNKDWILDEIKETILEIFTEKKFFSLRINGIEITQAIQYYHADRHLTDSADRGPDNSIRLVTNKPTWVRVYLRNRSLFANQIDNVSGYIKLYRRKNGFFWNHVKDLSPEAPGVVNAESWPTYDNERSNINSSLNFIIPPEDVIGNLRLEVYVESPEPIKLSDDVTVNTKATLHQTIRIAGIMVGYNGPNAAGTGNLNLAAPGLADLQATAAWMLTTYPISAATYRIAGTVTLTVPLTDAPSCSGCCSPNWVSLNSDIQQARVADGNNPGDVYYGLLANGIPMGPIIGCASGGVSSGSNGDQVTMAHEIGHVMGFMHAPCGVGGDPNYPAYEPYDPLNTPQASIGEYGLDINNGTVFSPQTHKDYMSYCGPRWISLYYYQRLINHGMLHPEIRGEDHFWWDEWLRIDPSQFMHPPLPDPPDLDPWRYRKMKPEPLISIIGVVRSNTFFEVHHVARLKAARDVSYGHRTDFIVELLDENGKQISTGPIYRLIDRTISSCPSSDPTAENDTYAFQAFLSDIAPGTLLRIVHKREELWSRQAPEAPPKIKVFEAKLDKNKMNTLVVECDIESERKESTDYWVRWSNDGGSTWHPLSIGLRGRRQKLSPDQLPAGKIALQAVAHDGFFSSVSKTLYVTVPSGPPIICIQQPQEGQKLAANRTMRLLGIATLRNGKTVDPKLCRWLIDGKEVGTGQNLYVVAPSEGKHRCKFTIGRGRSKAEMAVSFETIQIKPDVVISKK